MTKGKSILLVNAFFGAAIFSTFIAGPRIFDDPDKAEKFIRDTTNYEQIDVKGQSLIGCGKGYYFANKFNAVNTNGEKISGLVCRTLWTGVSEIKGIAPN